jgi:hypothetical protein
MGYGEQLGIVILRRRAKERCRGSKGCMNRNGIDRDKCKEGTNEGFEGTQRRGSGDVLTGENSL